MCVCLRARVCVYVCVCLCESVKHVSNNYVQEFIPINWHNICVFGYYFMFSFDDSYSEFNSKFEKKKKNS